MNSTPTVPERALQQYDGKRYEIPYTACRLFTSTFVSHPFGSVSQYSLLCCCSVRSVATHNTKMRLYSFCRNIRSRYAEEHVWRSSATFSLMETNTVNCIKTCLPVCCETIADLKVCVRLLKGGVQVGFLSLGNAP